MTRDGAVITWLDAGDADQVAAVEVAYASDALGAEHMADAGDSVLGNVTSIAFGGPGRRTAYLGSLLNDHVLALELPVAGVA